MKPPQIYHLQSIIFCLTLVYNFIALQAKVVPLEDDNNISPMSNHISFFAKLEARVSEVDSHLCVGLDPHIKELFPDGDGDSKSEQERCDAAFSFCKRIIDATGKFKMEESVFWM